MDQASPKSGPVSPKTGEASAKTGPAAANGDQASLNYVPVQHTALKNAEIIPMSLRSVDRYAGRCRRRVRAQRRQRLRPAGPASRTPRLRLAGHKHAVAGSWPRPSASARTELARTLSEFPDDSVVLLDGLVACGVPEIIAPEAERLRLAVLVHLPLGDETGLAAAVAAELDAKERATPRAASAVVATSDWAVRRLVAHHGARPERVHVAAPGADIGLASGTDGRLPAAVRRRGHPAQGQHRLIEALATVTDLPWSCVCVGGLTQDHDVAQLRGLIEKYGLGDRLHLAGLQAGAELDASYAAADLMVLTSYAETYGMAVTEALARGIPVLATDVGGLPEAVGRAPDGGVPGILVPPENPAALAAELRGWFGEADVRRRLKAAARGRRAALDGWATTARSLAGVLDVFRSSLGGRHEYDCDSVGSSGTGRVGGGRAGWCVRGSGQRVSAPDDDVPRYAPQWLQLRSRRMPPHGAPELLDPLRCRGQPAGPRRRSGGPRPRLRHRLHGPLALRPTPSTGSCTTGTHACTSRHRGRTARGRRRQPGHGHHPAR